MALLLVGWKFPIDVLQFIRVILMSSHIYLAILVDSPDIDADQMKLRGIGRKKRRLEF
jgi:hypothetical protein